MEACNPKKQEDQESADTHTAREPVQGSHAGEQQGGAARNDSTHKEQSSKHSEFSWMEIKCCEEEEKSGGCGGFPIERYRGCCLQT
ncbi:hypothetical protein GDO78_014427 [Eleutherodactylus coqui]|uniref:Uncharacterized protein n=1 Tax=Eleutherodactylus coqui TaxID=57060 RepID=A0A8J6JQ55_ELECQ|nr:hypothetical protein GDO78_014427 [Eleutherodactylus coqui]